jgi:hypothetical protein
MPDYSQRKKLMPFVGKYVQVKGISFERNGTHAIVSTTIRWISSSEFAAETTIRTLYQVAGTSSLLRRFAAVNR